MKLLFHEATGTLQHKQMCIHWCQTLWHIICALKEKKFYLMTVVVTVLLSCTRHPLDTATLAPLCRPGTQECRHSVCPANLQLCAECAISALLIAWLR